MKISKLISLLQKIQDKEGDIPVCHSEYNEYWGSIETRIDEISDLAVRDEAHPDGPKNEPQKCN